MTHITLKDGKPSVIYRYTKDEAGAYVQGVAARDLTDEDLAAYSPDQRAGIAAEAGKKDGAYKKVATVPRALSADHEPEPVEVTPAVEPTPEPAATSGKKGS